jgi:hypothetical protein
MAAWAGGVGWSERLARGITTNVYWVFFGVMKIFGNHIVAMFAQLHKNPKDQ